MAGRWIKRRGVRKLPSGAYLVTGDEDDEAEIFLEKRARAMLNKADVNAELESYLKTLEPDLAVPQALVKRWDDERVQALLEAHQEAPYEQIEPEPGSVRKAAQPGDVTWSLIEKAAQRVKAEVGDVMTQAECVEEALRRNPALYNRYREELLAGS